jgi:cell division transport system permease protein
MGEGLLRRFSALAYITARGARGMSQSPLVQLIAIGTMAVCMLMLGTVSLVFSNAQAVTQEWGVDVPLTVYMVEGVEVSESETLVRRLEALPEVESAERITPEVALERLEHGLGGHGGALDGIDAEALPDSIELHLNSDVDPAFAPRLAERIEAFEEVEEVALLGAWVEQAETMLSTLRNLAVGIGLLVGLACMAIVWSTIRLGVFARRSELEILRLVGGTHRFVRGPFVVEGIIQGVVGTGLAVGVLWFAFDFLRPFLEEGLSMVFAAGAIHFFTPVQILVALVFGAAVGFAGSRAAVARYVEV